MFAYYNSCVEKNYFEYYVSYFNRKRRFKKALPSLIILAVYATAYTAMVLSLLTKNASVAFISSFAILICSILLIAKPLTTNEKMGVLGWLESIMYFTVSIILVSVYIFTIVPSDYKATAITIFSTCIGGVMTLYGVGVTIKYSRIDKHNDELKRIRPNIVFISPNSWNNLPSDKKMSFLVEVNEEQSDLKAADKTSRKSMFFPIRIANLGETMVTVYGIMINDATIKFDYESVLMRNSFNELIINYKFESLQHIDEIIMLFEDIQRNIYFAKMRFNVEEKKINKTTKIDVTSVTEMKLIDESRDFQ